jgi:hypothetical protein
MLLQPEKDDKPVTNVVDRIELFLSPGDPSPRDQGQQRYWQKVFRVRLDAVKKDKLVPEIAGWRYLIGMRSGNALYATIDSKGKMTGLSRGPEATVAFRAAQEIITLPEAAKKDYHLWVLTIPGLLTECFWLKSTDKKVPDLVVPFFTSQALRCGHVYGIDEFLDIIGPLAKARLDLERKAKEPGADKKWITERQKEIEKRITEQDKMRRRTEARRLLAEDRLKKAEKNAASTRQKARNAAIDHKVDKS